MHIYIYTDVYTYIDPNVFGLFISDAYPIGHASSYLNIPMIQGQTVTFLLTGKLSTISSSIPIFAG